MDPNANMREQIAAHKQGIYSQAEQNRLHELVDAYAQWRASGGFAADAELRAELASISTPGSPSSGAELRPFSSGS